MYETHDHISHTFLSLLLMDGITVKINYSRVCWGPTGTPSRTYDYENHCIKESVYVIDQCKKSSWLHPLWFNVGKVQGGWAILLSSFLHCTVVQLCSFMLVNIEVLAVKTKQKWGKCHYSLLLHAVCKLYIHKESQAAWERNENGVIYVWVI